MEDGRDEQAGQVHILWYTYIYEHLNIHINMKVNKSQVHCGVHTERHGASGQHRDDQDAHTAT